LKDPIELNSLPSEDKRPQRSQMAMNSPLTREQFKAREIEQPAPDTAAKTAENGEVMSTIQSQYRAMTVKGRKEQRLRLRDKLGLDGKPMSPRVRFASPVAKKASDELVVDKLYSVGKPSDQAE